MSEPSAPCPACGSTRCESVYSVPSVPTNSCLLVDTADEARNLPRGELDLMLCHQCGYLFNALFDERLTGYDERYEDSQAFSGTFAEYGRGLAKTWVEEHDLAGRTVVEIGAGRGDFSRMLLEAGAGSVIAIDPTIKPERVGDTMDGRIVLRAERFDASTGLPPCDAVVFRHVLEHVAEPRTLLRDLYAALAGRPDVPVLVEVPDTKRVLEESAFWDVYYEHCGYFVEQSAVTLFASCGFVVDSIDRGFDEQYLLLSAHAEPRAELGGAVPVPLGLARQAREFASSVTGEIASWQAELRRRSAAGADIVLWGSGSKSTAFLTVIGADADAVSRVVDVNPHKQGRFMLGSGHPIVSPGSLAAQPPQLVVVMNPVYLDEIRQDLASLEIAADVMALGVDLT
ncbi:class I SAM-dependent methyltransferase [Luteipulveratus mongoliensis]|uniref:C-methyltransferase domain-containing protein n=1 Tax=Luteipulveratus mongoliensis TaxID=571913 RepID=A0A0K1JGU2_9MICO|nr:class I SAM-dependent methyltransferase [Luteipulveratus mongoliensis]AKU15934.1 hypothetical protein VV02_08825 [Luteipulveratus mongoliensis]